MCIRDSIRAIYDGLAAMGIYNVGLCIILFTLVSKMCIRDRCYPVRSVILLRYARVLPLYLIHSAVSYTHLHHSLRYGFIPPAMLLYQCLHIPKLRCCLLYTSEVASLLDFVEHGGDHLTGQKLAYYEKTKERDLAIITLLLGTGTVSYTHLYN